MSRPTKTAALVGLLIIVAGGGMAQAAAVNLVGDPTFEIGGALHGDGPGDGPFWTGIDRWYTGGELDNVPCPAETWSDPDWCAQAMEGELPFRQDLEYGGPPVTFVSETRYDYYFWAVYRNYGEPNTVFRSMAVGYMDGGSFVEVDKVNQVVHHTSAGSPTRGWTNSPASYTTGAAGAELGQQITIEMNVGAGSVDNPHAFIDDVKLTATGKLTINKFLDKDIDGVYENGVGVGSDELLSGWNYTAVSATSGPHSITTGVGGTVTRTLLEPGAYTVTELDVGPGESKDYWDVAGANPRAVTVPDNATGVVWFGNRPILGDADANGIVDISDFFILKVNFDADPAVWAEGNFNDDTLVDISDFFVLKANFDATHPDYVPPGGAAAPTPEPATIGLLALGACLALARRRRG